MPDSPLPAARAVSVATAPIVTPRPRPARTFLTHAGMLLLIAFDGALLAIGIEVLA